MSKFEKALLRLKSRPNDFTWRELQTLMTKFGYQEVKGGGSRRKFIHPQRQLVVSLHEPHPKPIVKRYALDIILNHLREAGLID